MDSTLGARDAFMPHQPKGMGAGLLLALLAHLLLVVALSFSVNWRAGESAGVEAELWAALPQATAPRANEPEPRPVPRPPPPPPVKAVAPPAPAQPTPPAPRGVDAQIAIEKARKAETAERAEQAEQAERARREAARKDLLRKEEAARKADQREQTRREAAEREKLQAKQRDQEEAATKKKEEAEAQRQAKALEAQREANLKRIAGMAGASGDERATGSGAQSAGPSAGYAGRIVARIKPKIVFADTVAGNPVATVEVRVAPDGTITSRRIVKSSGVPAWDDAVLRAIDRTEVLPRDTDGRVPPSFAIDFRPRD